MKYVRRILAVVILGGTLITVFPATINEPDDLQRRPPAVRAVDIPTLIKQYAAEFQVDPKTALDIAYCESRYDPLAKNKTGTAKGVYQFTDPTWKYIGAENTQFDYKENIKQFMIHYPKNPEWWSECIK